MARESIGRLLSALSIVVALVALSTWWSSLLIARAAGTLNAAEQSLARRSIISQLDHLVANSASTPAASQAITTALHNPQVGQALATSVPAGSSVLSTVLVHLDSALSSVLHGQQLVIDTGRHELGATASRLRRDARSALIMAALLAAGALIIAPLRHLLLRRLAFSAALVAGLCLALSWALPAFLEHLTTGETHRFFAVIVSGDAPVRGMLFGVLAIGTGLYLATHLFELAGGPRFTSTNSAPLASGRAV